MRFLPSAGNALYRLSYASKVKWMVVVAARFEPATKKYEFSALPTELCSQTGRPWWDRTTVCWNQNPVPYQLGERPSTNVTTYFDADGAF